MAQRRMFSMKIVDTDAFLDMPLSSQVLYFHLAMRADDDGFVGNPKKVMRMIGTQDDDMKVLLSKRFILPFENGVCVIKHWKIHNYIQKDRYTETTYLREKKMLELNDNNSYTECVQDVSRMETHVSLCKVSKDMVREETQRVSYGELENVKLTPEEYQKLVDLMGENNVRILILDLDTYIASKGVRYKSHYATIQSWARRKNQEMQNKSKGKRIISA